MNTPERLVQVLVLLALAAPAGLLVMLTFGSIPCRPLT